MGANASVIAGGTRSQSVGPHSTARVWHMTKLWAAMKDLPEVGALAFLCGGVLTIGVYTARRMYFSPAGDSFPNPEVRRDPEKQIAYGPEYFKPSIFRHVAEWRHDDKGYNIGVFNWNRTRPFEYNLPTSSSAHSAPQYETRPEPAAGTPAVA